uniref:Uncharacterized protein n=1 Tax=Bionectria ochroleuca TaxID=29856 RepID=A0A0B7K7N2_BIOOC
MMAVSYGSRKKNALRRIWRIVICILVF